MAEEFKEGIVLVHRGGAKRTASWAGWVGLNKGTNRASCWLRLGAMAGSASFSLGHGWGAKPVDDWRISRESLAALRAWALENGREIHAVPRSTGRPRRPRRGRTPHPRQVDLFK